MTTSQPTALAEAPALTAEQFTEALTNFSKSQADYVYALVALHATPEDMQSAAVTFERARQELYGLVGLTAPEAE